MLSTVKFVRVVLCNWVNGSARLSMEMTRAYLNCGPGTMPLLIILIEMFSPLIVVFIIGSCFDGILTKTSKTSSQASYSFKLSIQHSSSYFPEMNVITLEANR